MNDIKEEIIIKFLTEEYYEKACALINKNLKKEDNQIDESSITGKINENCKILGALRDNQVVGLIVVSIINKPFKSYKYLQLDYVCTDPDCRRMGIGNKLLIECEKFAKENNCKQITFTSSYSRTDAHNFYLKHDYKIVESAVFKKEI